MRLRVVGMIVAVLFAGLPASGGADPALSGGADPALSGGADPALAILGKGAQRLPDGHYVVRLADGTTLHTHGPDPRPNHGGSMGVGDPERAPVCASDYYQHVLYGHLSSNASRYDTVKLTIQASIRRMNAVLDEEAMESGNVHADYKVLCDGDGQIRIDSFSSNALDFDSIVTAARAAGFTDTNADYTIFFDAQPNNVCGVANITDDDRAGANNWNNSGGDYAVAYSGCWNNETPMHENGHNQGAVQGSADRSTGDTGNHCIDEEDVMCYSPDGGNKNQAGTIDVCLDRIHFDCGHDDYFDAAPETGEYLESHWNLGSPVNRFISFSGTDYPPVAGLSLTCNGLTCQFGDESVDDQGIASRTWDFGDGSASTLSNPHHTYQAEGTYLVTLSVRDGEDNAAVARQTVVVPNNGDPDPDTPTIQRGVAITDQNGRNGSWKYYKLPVPPGRHSVRVTLDGPTCTLFVCNPDLDLYVTQGARPDATENDCASEELSNDEVCVVENAGAGYWYVGVRVFFGAPTLGPVDLSPYSRATYTLTATY